MLDDSRENDEWLPDVYMLFTVSLILQDNWTSLEKPYGSIFLSIPTILDSSLAPKGHHILHIFTTASMEDWKVNIVLDLDSAYCRFVAQYLVGKMNSSLNK